MASNKAKKAPAGSSSLLRLASNLIIETLSQASGFDDPQLFKQELLRALDDHDGFAQVLQDWHTRQAGGQSRAKQSLKAKNYKKPLGQAGRPQAARYEGGARSKRGSAKVKKA